MQTVWNVLTIRCTRKLLKLLEAEANVDPPSPTNRLGNWYAKPVFVRHVPLIICISERSLRPVCGELLILAETTSETQSCESLTYR